jgi:acyl-coenzyme A synthetase/AMP-(fatty) acid ligase
VEEIVYARTEVAEAAAVCAAHPALGQAIVLVAHFAPGAAPDAATLLSALKAHLPGYMVPQKVVISEEALPRNPNGKIDRKLLAARHAGEFGEVQQ